MASSTSLLENEKRSVDVGLEIKGTESAAEPAPQQVDSTFPQDAAVTGPTAYSLPNTDDRDKAQVAEIDDDSRVSIPDQPARKRRKKEDEVADTSQTPAAVWCERDTTELRQFVPFVNPVCG